jgi:excisionase family DNA binding protein
MRLGDPLNPPAHSLPPTTPRTWMYAVLPHHDDDSDLQRAAVRRIAAQDDDHLCTPREVAELFGVRTTTIARWSREGRLAALLTPGGHRRYRLSDVRALLTGDDSAETDADREAAEDAVRLYEQGWSIRQVAEKFDLEYSSMRRLLQRNGVRFRRQGQYGPRP